MLENRPIISTVIGYIIGIILGLYCKISIVFLYLFVVFMYLITNKSKKEKFKLISFKRYSRYIKIILTRKVILLIVFSSIVSNSIVLYQNFNYNNLYKFPKEQNLNIDAVIVSNVKEKNNKKVYKLKVKKINENNKYKNTFLYLNVKKKFNINLEYGDKIKLSGKYIKPQTRRNYKGFNYREYLKTLKVYGSIDSDEVKVYGKSKLNIFLISNNISLKIKKIIKENFNQNTGDLLVGLILGDTSNIEDEIRQNFNESNISHILAVSGMHVGYITICIKFILDKLIGKRKSKIGTSIVIICYMLITVFSPSVVRAGLMAITSLMAGVFYRKSDIWSNIALSLLVLLIYNPFLIKSTSLLLSFAGTIGIILLHNNFKSITISATLFVMPIMVICFNKVALFSLIISMMVGFIIGPIIILGFIFIICFKLLIFLKLKFFYIKILNTLLEILINIAKLGSNLPFNKIYVTTPNILEIICYYCFILIRCFYI